MAWLNIAFHRNKRLKNRKCMLDAGHLDVLDVADIVAFMKGKQLYPNKTRIERLFNKALGRWRIMPEGEEKQRFNMVCVDLKDMLRWVFTNCK